jgi:hypothetical protein
VSLTSLPLPDGDSFAASDRLILVDQMEAVSAANVTIGGEATPQLAVHVTIAGKRNNSTVRDDVTFALSPIDALGLVNILLHNLEVITDHQKAAE